MPINVVRTPEEEIAWERAKARAREEYPDATGERFYRIFMPFTRRLPTTSRVRCLWPRGDFDEQGTRTKFGSTWVTLGQKSAGRPKAKV
jgi:hypothetical protein